jgi:hypothetical protein
MTGLKGGHAACLGVDARDGACVVVRAARLRGRLVLADGTPDAMASGCPAAAAMPVRDTVARWVEAPFASFRKTRRVLPTLLDVGLPFALEQCCMSTAALERGAEGTTRALAVVARHADVDRRLEALRARNVNPDVLDHEGLALWTQSLRERPPAAGDPDLRIVADYDASRTVLALGRGARFLGAYTARAGDAAALDRLLRAGTRGAPEPALWIRTGPRAEDGGGPDAAWAGPVWTAERPAAFLARALATRALTSGPYPVNLRTGARAHPARLARMRRAGRRAAGLVLAAGLILLGAAWGAGHAARRAEADIDRAFRARVDALAGYPVAARRADAIRLVRQEVAARAARDAPFLAPFAPSLLDLAAAAARTAEHDGLDLRALTLGGDAVTVEGTAPTWEGMDALRDLFAAAGYAVRLERDEALLDERVVFTVMPDAESN